MGLADIYERLTAPRKVECVLKVCVMGVWSGGDPLIVGVTLHRRNGWSRGILARDQPGVVAECLKRLRGRQRVFFHAVILGDDVTLGEELVTSPSW